MNYRNHFKDANRIVVKIGTSSLTYGNGSLNVKRIERLSWVLSDIRNQGKDVILVTSGAIGVGISRLSLPERPEEVSQKQAAAAVGQSVLMQIYNNFFMTYNQKVAQILLTKDNVANGEKKDNVVNTFKTLLELGVIPIVNANDTVATDEIAFFSDNDMLSAYVSVLMKADILIILTDTGGLYNKDPKTNEDAVLLNVVEDINGEIVSMGGGAGSSRGTGGMRAKIAAAKLACEDGVDVVVASGEDPLIVDKILQGDLVGTVFKAKK